MQEYTAYIWYLQKVYFLFNLESFFDQQMYIRASGQISIHLNI